MDVTTTPVVNKAAETENLTVVTAELVKDTAVLAKLTADGAKLASKEVLTKIKHNPVLYVSLVVIIVLLIINIIISSRRHQCTQSAQDKV